MSTAIKKVEAQPVVELQVADEEIRGLRAQTEGLTADTPASYELVKQSLAECRRLKRVATDNKKQLKARALAWGRAVDAEFNRVVGMIDEIADPLKATKKAADDEKERILREAQEKERLEREAKERAEREAREAVERAERERIEKEREAERKRIAEENAKLKQELKESRERVAKERAEREKAEAEMRRRQEEAEAKERAEKERKEAAERAKREKAEREKREKEDAALREQRKPDAEKLMDYADALTCLASDEEDFVELDVCTLIPPQMSTDWGCRIRKWICDAIYEIAELIKSEVDHASN
jgi:hypothetical protein